MNLTERNLIAGLEGCGKSSAIFEHLNSIATVENPVLFGFKNYSLMTEQVKTWSERFGIPTEEFAICGRNTRNEKAMEAYTDPRNPAMIGPKVRFVLTSQASIQRRTHNQFSTEDGEELKFSHIVIDEFDFATGIIPSLDYELCNMQGGEVKETTIAQKLDWIERHYTLLDRNVLHAALVKHKSEFILATWIQKCEAPLTFLSSETLVKHLFEGLGFNIITLGVSDFKHHKVAVWDNPHIGRRFFNSMNKKVCWNKLPFDTIISDCVNTYFAGNSKDSLEVSVISHMGARGSNSFIGKNILTVLSHIPSQHVKFIKDCLSQFNKEMTFVEVQNLFYRDRLCQAVGRVLGYRASDSEATTFLIAHSSLLESIDRDSFPYSIESWDFEFEDKEWLVQDLVNKAERATITKEFAKEAQDYTYLQEFFEPQEDAEMTIPQLKEYLKSKHLKSIPATKLAAYFGGEIKTVRKNGEVCRVLKGVALK